MTENGVAPVAPDEDRTPTQESDLPPEKPADAWVMPEPVFRQSDGFTPRKASGNEDETVTPDHVTIAEAKSQPGTAGASPLIAEQPDISEVASLESASTVSAPKSSGGFLRLFLLVLGIAGVAVVIGVIVTAILLWYFSQVSESQNLN